MLFFSFGKYIKWIKIYQIFEIPKKMKIPAGCTSILYNFDLWIFKENQIVS